MNQKITENVKNEIKAFLFFSLQQNQKNEKFKYSANM
jgi:hypothetical protein